ncbi:hypothetical protein PILCRDRAFT_82877 [Piloderma croceum F 1598]|uniref:Uncharacterized protein n=1 Tax=Piloderma croceum (strain F 1598) TaxID=765440 RepID=A0A0C3EFA1_PILCF|nr:hypothetical protein PILCRDRAFT_82877 [Piloderma croceum F 1598]
MIFTAYYFHVYGAHALPILTADENTLSSCDNLQHCRTLLNIIWSCVVTIFSCTWVAVHPNIPGPHDGWFTIAFRRLALMGLAIIAPEAIILWSIRQWIVAGTLAGEHRVVGWTRAHAYFAIMGGFMLCEDETELYTLKRQLDTKDPAKSLEFFMSEINITEREIKDKSKGDMLSKVLVLLQTGWFVLQCIGRLVEHLPLTEIELVTIGFAILNLATYIFWWDKPLNVGCPVRIFVKKQISENGRGGGECDGGGAGATGKGSPGGELEELKDGRILISAQLAEYGSTVRNAPGVIRGIVSDTIQDTVDSVRDNGVPFVIWNWVWTILKHIFWTPLGVFIDWLFGHDDRPQEETRVCTLFAGSLNKDSDAIGAGLIATLVASIFGAVHCIAWSFQFPSHAEKILWRICSMCITCLPWPVFACTAIIAVDWSRPAWLTILVRATGYTLVCFYITARITLLVQALMSLRSLPPGAYETVYWTTYIPHI